MRDKKDNATFDLPGFEAPPLPPVAAEPKPSVARPRKATLKQEQEQLLLLDDTDASGLPVWRRDDNLDLTGLPIWAPA